MKFFYLIFFFSCVNVFGQFGPLSIKSDGQNSVNSSAFLDINYNNKGLLLPRIDLNLTSSPLPLFQFTDGMFLYNKKNSNDVSEGLYVCKQGKWNRFKSIFPLVLPSTKVGITSPNGYTYTNNLSVDATRFTVFNNIRGGANIFMSSSTLWNQSYVNGIGPDYYYSDINDGTNSGGNTVTPGGFLGKVYVWLSNYSYDKINFYPFNLPLKYWRVNTSYYRYGPNVDYYSEKNYLDLGESNQILTFNSSKNIFSKVYNNCLPVDDYFSFYSQLPYSHDLNAIKMQLSGGVIQRGGSVGITGTQDLGLYSCSPGNYVRIGTNNSSIRFYTDLDTNGSFGSVSKLTIESNGNVGIGTEAPTLGKLQINGYATQNNANYGFLNGSGASGFVGGNQPNLRYSIWADSRIACNEFNAFSDERLKKFISYSDSKEDLTILNKIKIINYTKIDSVNDPNRYKKVFAQQLEKVFPQAVHQSKGYIPNIYKLVMADKGVVKIPNSLKKGDKVKLILEKDEMIVNVVEATKYSFKIDKEISQQVFVYGVEVDDLRNVDYDAIAMLNVSATIELSKKIDAIHKKIKKLNYFYSDKVKYSKRVKHF